MYLLYLLNLKYYIFIAQKELKAIFLLGHYSMTFVILFDEQSSKHVTESGKACRSKWKKIDFFKKKILIQKRIFLYKIFFYY